MTGPALVDRVLGNGPGHLAVAFGHGGHWVGSTWKFAPSAPEHRFYAWPAERDRFSADVAALAGSADAYWCPALRTVAQRRKGTAVELLSWLWADVDHALTVEQVALLDTLDPVRVASGGGVGRLHLYVPLSEPVDLATHTRLNRSLAAALGADSKWSDESLLRLPGTTNHKTGALVAVLDGGGRPWSPGDLAALLPVDSATSTAGPMVVPEGEPAPDPLPVAVAELLVDQGAADRSTAHHALVAACKDSGLTLGQAVTVVATFAPSVEKYGARLAEEVARSWHKIDATRGAATAMAAGRPGWATPFLLPGEFWDVSETLRHVRDAALSRRVCPDAVLHSVLTILASKVEYHSRVETGIGASVLAYYFAPVGIPAAGKTRALECATDLMEKWTPQSGDEFASELLGSGEGVIDAYMGADYMPDPTGRVKADGNPVMIKQRKQTRHNALFHTDEGRSALTIGTRSGSTLFGTLCEMWSGARVGQSNADAERRRKLERGTYALGVLVGFQVDTVAALFEDAAGGLPQRFAFAPAEYPPYAHAGARTDWPGPLDLATPTGRVTVTLDPAARDEVDRGASLRAAGIRDGGPLDGHRTLMQARVAALLALLHAQPSPSSAPAGGTGGPFDFRGRIDTTDIACDPAWWGWAGEIVGRSCDLRDVLVDQGRQRVFADLAARRDRQVDTGARTAWAIDRHQRIGETVELLVKAVEDAGGDGLTPGRLLNHSKRRRDVAPEALDQAVARGLLVLVGEGRGQRVQLPEDPDA